MRKLTIHNAFQRFNDNTSGSVVENGLGEGILITCQYDYECKESGTFGPLPLDIFHD